MEEEEHNHPEGAGHILLEGAGHILHKGAEQLTQGEGLHVIGRLKPAFVSGEAECYILLPSIHVILWDC